MSLEDAPGRYRADMRVRRFAGVIAVHQERVVLVREHYRHWDGEYWSIPSGMVESHERPVEGAARELAEETGLVVSTGDLELVGTSSTAGDNGRSLAWNYRVAVRDADLRVADPDGCILEARWFTLDESLARLSRLPYRPIAEPVVAYLTHRVGPGADWVYPAADADPVVTLLPR